MHWNPLHEYLTIHDMELEIPRVVPVMTLPETVLFPQAILPLYIFEPRYQLMLKDALEGERLLAITCLDQGEPLEDGSFEPPSKTASIGIIRACQENPDDTANIILQGLARIQILNIAREEPYRMINIAPLESRAEQPPDGFVSRRAAIRNLLDEMADLGEALSRKLMDHLDRIDDPEVFIDLMAYSICSDPVCKQNLLETLDTAERYQLFIQWLSGRNQAVRLQRKMQGSMEDEDIGLN